MYQHKIFSIGCHGINKPKNFCGPNQNALNVPTIFFQKNEDIRNITLDLTGAGHPNNSISCIMLSQQDMDEAKRLINQELASPFIYIPADNSVDCKIFLLLYLLSFPVESRKFHTS